MSPLKESIVEDAALTRLGELDYVAGYRPHLHQSLRLAILGDTLLLKLLSGVLNVKGATDKL